VLEEYLKTFEGCVLIVSHDRFFMDKIVEHLFVFEGNGKVADFSGNYSVYREQMESKINPVAKDPFKPVKGTDNNKSDTRRKLSFKEKQEMYLLEEELDRLGKKINMLESELNSGKLNHEQLHLKSEELMQFKKKIDEMEFRWLELSEKN
jgi:ATP-binding cassette subfamily F protein uup